MSKTVDGAKKLTDCLDLQGKFAIIDISKMGGYGNMELGISFFNGVSIENQVKGFLKHGIKHTFIMSDHPEFEKYMELFRENGIICDNLHAPFKGINAFGIWYRYEQFKRGKIFRRISW